jgi:hypothetical protein
MDGDWGEDRGVHGIRVGFGFGYCLGLGVCGRLSERCGGGNDLMFIRLLFCTILGVESV